MSYPSRNKLAPPPPGYRGWRYYTRPGPRSKRLFVEDVRWHGQSIHIRELPCGAGVPRKTCGEVFYGRYVPGAVLLDGQEISLTWVRSKSPLGGGKHYFLCPTCGRRCCELFQFQWGGPWECRLCCKGGLVYGCSYRNRYVRKQRERTQESS